MLNLFLHAALVGKNKSRKAKSLYAIQENQLVIQQDIQKLPVQLQTVSQSQTTSIHKSTTDKPIFSKPRIKRGFGKLPIARN